MKPERERRNSTSEQKKLTKQNNILWIIVAVVVIAFCAYSFLTSDLEHIEDTNGPDNYALAVITDEDIVKQEMGALNVGLSKDVFASGVTCSSSKFTGVYRVFQTNFLFNSDFRMDLLNFHVNSGNFRMCLVNNGKIIAEVEPGMTSEVLLHDLNGSFELVIAGESADFTFYMDSWFCEQYNITVGD